MAPQYHHEDYTVGWICALPIEMAAARLMLDEEHQAPQSLNESTLYTLGRIGEHNVVIAGLPAGRTGTGSAATAAVRMMTTFKRIRFGLMVGIGGGVPNAENDIRLGDVVISHPHNDHGGVVQYDFGKSTANGFLRTGSLNQPPTILLHALASLQANHFLNKSSLSDYLSKFNHLPLFKRDTAGPDRLFESDYQHTSGSTCVHCDPSKLITRPERTDSKVVIHYGTIASGNQVIKNGIVRDELSSKLGTVLCFEMEAAGLMNDFPCLVIRGICDYADSHKSNAWQPFAAAAAAASTKELLSIIPGSGPGGETHTNRLPSDYRPLGETHQRKFLTDGQEIYGAAEQAAEVQERLLGIDHQDTLTSIHSLGASLFNQQKYSAAEREFRRAAEGRERLLGIDHEQTLLSLQCLGESLYNQKNYSAAEPEFRQAAEGRERLLGVDHKHTLLSIQWLGNALYGQQKYKEAEQEFRRAAEGRERLLGIDHEHTLLSIQCLGESIYKQKNYSAAEPELRKAAEGRERVLGLDHRQTLLSLQWLGESLHNQKKHIAAEQEFRRVAEGRERLLGIDHAHTLLSIQWLGASLSFQQQKHNAAEREFRRAAEGRERVLGIDNEHTLLSIQSLGDSLYNQQKYNAAEREYRRAAEGRARLLRADNKESKTSG